MALDYETDRKLKAIAPVIDDHAEWFGRATKRLFFPESYKGRPLLEPPSVFQAWRKEAGAYDFIEQITLDDLSALFDELHRAATALMNKAVFEDESVPLAAYENFVSLYETFLFRLRRLEHDCALVDSGLDIETGLRSRGAMEIDMARELERSSRRGSPLALVLARIDNYADLKRRVDADSLRTMLRRMGRLIKKCMRSFDDAYRLAEGEFIMSVKHTEIAGGTAAVNRLRRFIANENLCVSIGGVETPLTMSYCVAAPVPEDTPDELIANMRRDLEKWIEDGDTALEYHEVSPLQRFIGDEN